MALAVVQSLVPRTSYGCFQLYLQAKGIHCPLLAYTGTAHMYTGIHASKILIHIIKKNKGDGDSKNMAVQTVHLHCWSGTGGDRQIL